MVGITGFGVGTVFEGSGVWGFASEDDEDGFQEDVQVEPGRAVVGVVNVVFDAFVPGDGGGAVDLGQAGAAGADQQPLAFEIIVGGDLIGQRGPGADDGHFAFEDVDQLRQFIDFRSANEFADGGDLRVVQGDEFLGIGFAAAAHGAELVGPEVFTVPTAAFLDEKDGSGTGQLDQQGHDQQHGAEQQQQSGGHEKVDHAAKGAVEAGDLFLAFWVNRRCSFAGRGGVILP